MSIAPELSSKRAPRDVTLTFVLSVTMKDDWTDCDEVAPTRPAKATMVVLPGCVIRIGPVYATGVLAEYCCPRSV